jgi:hypothetical protein
MDRDTEDLRRLALAHYVVGVLTALMALPFVVGTWWGVRLMRHPETLGEWSLLPSELDFPPELIAQMVVFFFASILLLVLVHAAVVAWVGWYIARARRYWVVYIFSLLDCTYVPFGTIIGIWALVVLHRPSVKVRFGLPVKKVPPGATE